MRLAAITRLDLVGTLHAPQAVRVVADGIQTTPEGTFDPWHMTFSDVSERAIAEHSELVRSAGDGVYNASGRAIINIVSPGAAASVVEGPPQWLFQAPPNWPPVPRGWVPPAGWTSDPAWGPEPDGWQFWVPATAENRMSDSPGVAPENLQLGPGVAPANREDAILASAGRFNCRPQLLEMHALCRELRESEAHSKKQLREMGALTTVEREERAKSAQQALASAETELEQHRSNLAEQLNRYQLRLDSDARRAEAVLIDRRQKAEAALHEVEDRRLRLEAEVVVTETTAVLQEVGVYEYTHPLDDAPAYKAALEVIKDQVRSMNRANGGAVTGTTSWLVNNNAAQGRKMVAEFSKLMLRAYNNEVDALVRSMKPYRLQSSSGRLEKARKTIERLGSTMDIRISSAYHHLRLRELSLTADHLAKMAEEKEQDREEKARLREERQAQLDFEREKQRLLKEQTHYKNAIVALRAKGDLQAAGRLEREVERIGRAVADVDYRAANIRAGYVYVISNLGSFGAQIIKVGMTRRLEPRDRVRELSDASVPFNFDIHAIHFSQDAVSVEAEMHRRLASRRVNLVNHRREFFYATPAEVRELLADVVGDLLEYAEHPEAAEFHQSENDRSHERPATRSGEVDGANLGS